MYPEGADVILTDLPTYRLTDLPTYRLTDISDSPLYARTRVYAYRAVTGNYGKDGKNLAPLRERPSDTRLTSEGES